MAGGVHLSDSKMNPRDPNVAYCRRCEEYHKANEEEDIDQLIADCEAGNW